MEKLRDKLTHFMYGRYGSDQLYYALFVIYIIFIIADVFIKSSVISFLASAVIIWMFFRSFSKNISKRRSENEKFMKLWSPIKLRSSLPLRRIKELKTHRFRKCPHCKGLLRLPSKRGKHTVKCPRCHKEFEIRILL